MFGLQASCEAIRMGCGYRTLRPWDYGDNSVADFLQLQSSSTLPLTQYEQKSNHSVYCIWSAEPNTTLYRHMIGILIRHLSTPFSIFSRLTLRRLPTGKLVLEP